jgi:hypothetical protein
MSLPERRTSERTRNHRSALISIPQLKHVHSCGVRDLSREGAGLRLAYLPLLPCEFKLTFDGFHNVLDCRLIWRDGDFAGIAFQPTANC